MQPCYQSPGHALAVRGKQHVGATSMHMQAPPAAPRGCRRLQHARSGTHPYAIGIPRACRVPFRAVVASPVLLSPGHGCFALCGPPPPCSACQQQHTDPGIRSQPLLAAWRAAGSHTQAPSSLTPCSRPRAASSCCTAWVSDHGSAGRAPHLRCCRRRRRRYLTSTRHLLWPSGTLAARCRRLALAAAAAARRAVTHRPTRRLTRRCTTMAPYCRRQRAGMGRRGTHAAARPSADQVHLPHSPHCEAGRGTGMYTCNGRDQAL